MAHPDINNEISKVLENPSLSRTEKIDELERMRQNARAEMRAASESAMVDDVDIGDDLQHLDKALDKLGSDTDSIEDKGASTL